MATPVTSGGNAKHRNGDRDPATNEIVSDRCSACNKQFNEVTGKPIILGGRKFHRACLNCDACHKRLQPGWTIVHPAGTFCSDQCLQNISKQAINMKRMNPCQPSNSDAKGFLFNFCHVCNMPIHKEDLETWLIIGWNMIHQQCFKCTACGNPPTSPEGNVIWLAHGFFCNDACIQRSGEKAVKVNLQSIAPGRVTDATKKAEGETVYFEDGSELCGVCNKSINEEAISCGEKQFHQSCFKCMQCDKRLEPGRLLMHPDGGLFCKGYFNSCMQRFGARAMQVSYKLSCNNDDNNSDVNNCLVCEMPINKSLETSCVNCSGSSIHRECFKCKACEETPPPEGEITTLMTSFFCDDECILIFGHNAVEVDYQPTAPAQVADATKETEDQTHGANEGKKIRQTKAAESPANVAEESPDEE